jgi:hypothetical protein
MDHLFTFFTTPGFTDERIHAFMATGLTRGNPNRESDEFIEIAVYPLSEVLLMIQRGEIQERTALSILFVQFGFVSQLRASRLGWRRNNRRTASSEADVGFEVSSVSSYGDNRACQNIVN